MVALYIATYIRNYTYIHTYVQNAISSIIIINYVVIQKYTFQLKIQLIQYTTLLLIITLK